jgi:hypothetical protein
MVWLPVDIRQYGFHSLKDARDLPDKTKVADFS